MYDAELFRVLASDSDLKKSIRNETGPRIKPRWKAERDLYIAVQAVDPTRAWLRLAEYMRWIKKKCSPEADGVGWQTTTGWDASVHNPITDRLEQ